MNYYTPKGPGLTAFLHFKVSVWTWPRIVLVVVYLARFGHYPDCAVAASPSTAICVAMKLAYLCMYAPICSQGVD